MHVKTFNYLLLLAMMVVVTGCHALPFRECTEKHADHVDDFADRRPWADHCYHAKLDLTRIGRSDGPACGRNQCCR